MHDSITHIGSSEIQHGKYNNRIYLMKLAKGDFPDIINKLERMAQTNGYSKIFAKVPPYAKDVFINNGFIVEASIPNFYNYEQAFFLAKFFNEERTHNHQFEKTDMVLKEARKRATLSETITLGSDFIYKSCSKSDAIQMAEVYKRVFATYPFPIDDPDHIMKTMERNVLYFAIWHNSKIVALSAAEIDAEFSNAEMTDFATLPEYTGRGFATFLLQLMESELRKRQINTAYTISRALSFSMNITFARTGYKYCGTLLNNTNISGHFESMHVWYKFI